MGAPRAPYMAKTDKERLATGFWNRIESNQAMDCNTLFPSIHLHLVYHREKELIPVMAMAANTSSTFSARKPPH